MHSSDTPSGEQLMATAQAEGVLAMLGQRSSQLRNASPEFLTQLAAAGRALAAESLLRQAETRKVLNAIPDDLPVLVLKGSALALWLYPQAYLRECGDVDLLFQSRDDAERAAALLRVHGYEVPYRSSVLAHEFLCRRVGGSTIDLDMHWKLSGQPIFQWTFDFPGLADASIALPVLGDLARGLGPVHAFAHACMHRASNVSSGIGDRLKWLYDIHLLAKHLGPTDWIQLQNACVDRQLAGVVDEALSATTGAFSTAVPESFRAEMTQSRVGESFDAARLTDWRYMQWQNVKSIPAQGDRIRWLYQRIVPTREYLRELYGAEVSAGALWLHRLRRALVRLRQ